MVDYTADQSLHLTLCGSIDMDRLAHFPASDVDGVFLVDIGAVVVYIPRSFYTSL